MTSITLQQAFDNAVNGMRKQRAFSTNVCRADCFYRATNGMRCAIGFSIPDEKYQLGFEGRPASYVFSQIFDSPPDLAAFDSLQSRLHDSMGRTGDAFDIQKFEDAAKKFANDFNLVYSPAIPA